MPEDVVARQPAFATTHWSVVLTAGRTDTTRAQNALAKLCSTYWYPLYAYVRRRGHSAHDAQDLTQAFFAQLLERQSFTHADPNRGRYDLAQETFSLVVPESYRPEVPHGLIVWVSPGTFGGATRPDLLRQLADRRLIWVGANGAGNERQRWYRFGLALDAAHNLQKLYRIDPERIYIAGYSGGGRISSVLSVVYPEVFSGGLFMVGCDWFRPLPIPDRPGTNWPVLYPKPGKRDLDLAKSRSRYVFLTAERDFNRIQTREVFHAFEREGFAHTTYIEVPGIGHYGPVPTPDWVRALDALDPVGAARVKPPP